MPKKQAFIDKSGVKFVENFQKNQKIKKFPSRTKKRYLTVFMQKSHYTSLVRSYGLRQEFIMPHCPQQNGMIERFIRTLKEQCVHRQRFESIQHANRVLADWIGFYNHQRPHQSLGMKSPVEVREALAA